MKPIYILFTILCTLVTSLTKSQNINTIAGTFYGNGQTAFAIGIVPSSQVVDTAGNIYFTEPERHVVRKLSANGVYSTVAGTGILGYSGDGGSATAAQLNYPYCIARDAPGNIYITDAPAGRIRKVDLNGIITTIAGNGTTGFSGDGGPAIQAQLNGANGIAVDNTGNVYITDFNNRRIRKISVTGIITTVAGTNNAGILGSGNGGPATSTQLSLPLSVAVNNTGELFIADVGLNNIRKVATNGIITAFAGPVYGGSGFSGDGGPATSALFNQITGITTDAAGNVFIADNSNSRVRKVSTSGIITTVAGNGNSGFTGDGGSATAAQLLNPNNVTVDAAGNIFVTTFNRIRKVTTGGIINTVAGNGTLSYNGNNLPVGGTQFYQPKGLVTDKQRNTLALRC